VCVNACAASHTQRCKSLPHAIGGMPEIKKGILNEDASECRFFFNVLGREGGGAGRGGGASVSQLSVRIITVRDPNGSCIHNDALFLFFVPAT